MAKFVYAYSGGRGMAATEEERNAQMEKWGAWMGGLGSALVDGGAPFGASRSVNGNGATKLTGYSIVEFGSLEDAVAKAEGCPVLESGGTVDVYEALPM